MGSPPPRRLAGLLYVLVAILGPFCLLYVPEAVRGNDAADTAARLREHASLVRLGVAGEVVLAALEVALSVLLFRMTRGLGSTVALMALAARLLMAALQSTGGLLLLAGVTAATFLPPTGSSGEDVAALAVALHDGSVAVWEPFFAVHCVAVGTLLGRAPAVPRPLGVLLACAGAGYAAHGLGSLLWPGAAPALEALAAVLAVGGEVPFVVWLVARGNAAPSRDGGALSRSRAQRSREHAGAP